MEFSVLFFISFLIIPDVQFDFLSTDVLLANIFRTQSAMTPRSLDSSQSLDNWDYFPCVNNRHCILFDILLPLPFPPDPSSNS